MNIIEKIESIEKNIDIMRIRALERELDELRAEIRQLRREIGLEKRIPRKKEGKVIR